VIEWCILAFAGTAAINTIFADYAPYAGDIQTRENGSLVAHETGQVTAYALEAVQERGILFVQPGVLLVL
jgi:GTP-binding protein